MRYLVDTDWIIDGLAEKEAALTTLNQLSSAGLIQLLDDFIEAGADIVTVDVQNGDAIPEATRRIHERQRAAGLAIGLDKDVIRAALFPPNYIEYSTRQDDLCVAAAWHTSNVRNGQDSTIGSSLYFVSLEQSRTSIALEPVHGGASKGGKRRVMAEGAASDTTDPHVAPVADEPKYSEEEYDAALAQIVQPQLSEFEEEFAQGHTYSLDEWLGGDESGARAQD